MNWILLYLLLIKLTNIPWTPIIDFNIPLAFVSTHTIPNLVYTCHSFQPDILVNAGDVHRVYVAVLDLRVHGECEAVMFDFVFECFEDLACLAEWHAVSRSLAEVVQEWFR